MKDVAPQWLDPDRWGAGPVLAAPPAPIVTPPRPRRSRAWWVVPAAFVAAVGVAVGVVLTDSGSSSGPSPADVVRGYLHDLATADAAAALRAGPAPRSTALLTAAILRRQQQAAPLTAVRIISSATHGSQAEVRARYRFGTRVADETFSLAEHGHWQLDATTVRIDVSTLTAIPAPTLFDRPIGTVGSVEVFPGPLMWGSGNRFFAVVNRDAAGFALSPADPNASYTALAAHLNDAGRRAVITAAQRYVARCAASRSLAPHGCPQQQTDEHVVPNSARWQVRTDVAKALRYHPGEDAVTTYDVQARLYWKCTYRVGHGVLKSASGIEGDLDGSADLTAATPVFTPLD